MNSFPTEKRISTPSSSAFSLAENHYFVPRPLWVETGSPSGLCRGAADLADGHETDRKTAPWWRLQPVSVGKRKNESSTDLGHAAANSRMFGQ